MSAALQCFLPRMAIGVVLFDIFETKTFVMQLKKEEVSGHFFHTLFAFSSVISKENLVIKHMPKKKKRIMAAVSSSSSSSFN